MRLITNFDVDRKDVYQKAISIYKERTGDEGLYISDKAYWDNGRRDNTLYALRHMGKDNGQCSMIWDILKELKK